MQDGTITKMKTKISLNNFVLPYFIIKSACRDYGLYPFDIFINICDKDIPDASPVQFNINQGMSRKQINLTILNKYFTNFKSLHGVDLDASVVVNGLSSCSILSDLYFNNSQFNIPNANTNGQNFPYYVISTKNIIFPYYNIDHLDLNIYCQSDSCHDFSFNENELSIGIKNLKTEFRDAFILILSDYVFRNQKKNSSGFIKEALNSPDIMRMLYPFTVSYFNDDMIKSDAFIGLLQMYSDTVAGKHWFDSTVSPIKTARMNMDGNFWIYGLIEKMLAPARGPDFSVTKKWAPITNMIWENIESARKQSGLSGASLEFMLRVKDHGSSDDSIVIQKMIEELRP